MDRDRTLQLIWNQYLANMPRPKVNEVVEKLGIPKHMVTKLDDEGARKVVFGLITRLDQQVLAEVSPFLKSVVSS
jgi:hypothetical protein